MKSSKKYKDIGKKISMYHMHPLVNTYMVHLGLGKAHFASFKKETLQTWIFQLCIFGYYFVFPRKEDF